MAKHKADRKGNLFLPKGRRVDVSEQWSIIADIFYHK